MKRRWLNMGNLLTRINIQEFNNYKECIRPWEGREESRGSATGLVGFNTRRDKLMGLIITLHPPTTSSASRSGPSSNCHPRMACQVSPRQRNVPLSNPDAAMLRRECLLNGFYGHGSTRRGPIGPLIQGPGPTACRLRLNPARRHSGVGNHWRSLVGRWE